MTNALPVDDPARPHLTDDEFQQLLVEAQKEGHPWPCLVGLLRYTDLRLFQILRVKDSICRPGDDYVFTHRDTRHHTLLVPHHICPELKEILQNSKNQEDQVQQAPAGLPHKVWPLFGGICRGTAHLILCYLGDMAGLGRHVTPRVVRRVDGA